MIIADLDYLKPVLPETKVVGGAAGVLAEAAGAASGDETSVETETNAKAKDYGLFQIAFGTASARAVGDSATADTSVTGVGKGGTRRGPTFRGNWKTPGGKELALSYSAGWGFDF